MTNPTPSQPDTTRPSPKRTGSFLLLLPAVLGCLALAAALTHHFVTPTPAVLRIESNPSGASVFLNGGFRGTTPIEFGHIGPGRHVLRLALHHHQPWQQELELTEGLNHVSTMLITRQGGKLSISSTPPGATVYVDGNPKGVTPLVIKDLDPGVHPVQLVLPDYVEWTSSQQVNVGSITRIQAELVTRMESFLIRATQTHPDFLPNWTEMFHFYAVTHDYDKASTALAHALDTLVREAAQNAAHSRSLQRTISQLWSGKAEIDIGTDKEVRRSRNCITQGYTQALKLHPNETPLYGTLVELHARDRNIEKGNAIIEKGLAQFPYDRGWYFSNALGKRNDRKGKKTIERYTKNLEKHPNDLTSRLRLLTLLEQDGKLDEAIVEYPNLIKVIKTSEVRFALLQSMGTLMERRRRLDDAVATYEKALKEKAAPKYRAAVLYRIVRIKREAGDIEAMVSTWERAITLQPDVEYACRWRLALAQLCVEHERVGKAHTLCEDILSISKADSTRQAAQKLLRLQQLP